MFTQCTQRRYLFEKETHTVVTCNALPPTLVETNSFMSKSRPEEGQVHMLLRP